MNPPGSAPRAGAHFGPDEGARQLLDGPALLPSQQPARHEGLLGMPEGKLLAAVLEDAQLVIRRYYRAGRPELRALCHDDVVWMLSDDTRWPFSFVNACSWLGLDPSAVRRVTFGGDVPAAPGRRAGFAGQRGPGRGRVNGRAPVAVSMRGKRKG